MHSEKPGFLLNRVVTSSIHGIKDRSYYLGAPQKSVSSQFLISIMLRSIIAFVACSGLALAQNNTLQFFWPHAGVY